MKISEYTDEKLQIFNRFIVSAVQASARAIVKAQERPSRHVPPTLYLFDIGSADGDHTTRLLVDAARSVAGRFPIGYHVYGFEKKRQLAQQAQERYADNPHVTIMYGDVEEELHNVLVDVPPKAFGLAAIDLWGTPPWGVQEQLGLHCRTVDHLVFFPGGGYKRHPDQEESWLQERIPRENIHRVRKQYALIGRPQLQSQFVVTYFTNYDKLAHSRHSLGMVPLNSEAGQRRWAELHTISQPGVRAHMLKQKKEARELQMDLFGDADGSAGKPDE